MKTIILPNQGIRPRIVEHAGLIAEHISESEVILYDTDGFADGPLSEAPVYVSARDLLALGIIEAHEVLAVQLEQNKRQAEHSLKQSQKRMAELAASIERQQAELEAL